MTSGTRLASPRRGVADRVERRAPASRHRGAARTEATRACCTRSTSGSTVKVGIVGAFVGLKCRDADDRAIRRCRWRAARGRPTPESLAESCPTRSRRACRRRLRCGCSTQPGVALDLVGAAFDLVGPADGIDGVRDARLVRDDLLGAKRERRGFLRRQRERLVAAVAVQRLRAAQDGGKRLDRDADEIVVGLLGRQRAAGGLRVKPQLLRARAGRRRIAPS